MAREATQPCLSHRDVEPGERGIPASVYKRFLPTAANSVIEFYSPVQHMGEDSYSTHKYFSVPPDLSCFRRTVFHLKLLSLLSRSPICRPEQNMGIVTSRHIVSGIFSPWMFPARNVPFSTALIDRLPSGSLRKWTSLESGTDGLLRHVLMSQCCRAEPHTHINPSALR